LIRRLGEGAMGVVHEAEHVDLGRKVAIKLLQGRHSQSPEFVARFRREARAIASLSHQNLVHVYDFGQTAGRPEDSEWGGRLFFVMERLEGETLDAFLAREKGIDWRDACELAMKTCRALEAAHSAGLVHRDLKPENLFLTFQGRRPASVSEVGLKLLDFGVAKELRGGNAPPSATEAHGHDDPNLSKAGAVFGTPDTMAPEQVTGGDVDGRADIYALGCVLYEMLTGRTPFDAPSPILMMSCHLRDDARPPREVAPHRGIPEAVERVVLKALAKDRGARFADAGEMREALEEACYGGFFAGSDAPSAVMASAASSPPSSLGASSSSASPSLPTPSASLEGVFFAEPTRDVDLEASVAPADAPVELAADAPVRSYRRPIFAPLVFAGLASAAIVAFIATGQKPIDRDELSRALSSAPFGVQGSKPASAKPLAAAAPPPLAVATQAPLVDAPKPAPAPLATAPKALEATTSPPAGLPAAVKAPSPIAASQAHLVTPSDPSLKPPPSEIDARIAAGETDVALDLARAAKEDGTAASAAAWARAAFAAGRPDEAHQASLAWIARSSDNNAIEPRVFDARALRAAGRFDEARVRLEEILKAHPGQSEAKNMLRDLELLHPPKASPVRHLAKKKPMKKVLG
jgi:serine/threonine protein kinase